MMLLDIVEYFLFFDGFFVCLFVCFFSSQLSIVELDYENAITAMTLAHFRELGG